MSYRCPTCNELILVRRLGHCPACKTTLPEEMQLSAKRVQEIDQEEASRRANLEQKIQQQQNKQKRRLERRIIASYLIDTLFEPGGE